MVDPGRETLGRIQRLSRFMRALCTILIVLQPVAAFVRLEEPKFSFSSYGDYTYVPKTERDLEAETNQLEEKDIRQGSEFYWKLNELSLLSLEKTLALSLIALTQAGLMMFCIDRLRRLFDLYAHGVIFSAKNSRYLRIFAFSLLMVALSLPAFEALLTLVSSYEFSVASEATTVRHKYSFESSFTFGQRELAFIFIAMVFLVIARVMELGNALAAEQAQIV